MKFKLAFVLLLLISIFTQVHSQELTKKEKKEIKKEIKKLLKDPSKYKYMKESAEVKDVIINEQAKELSEVLKEKNLANSQLIMARDSIGEYEYTIQVYQDAGAPKSKLTETECSDNTGYKYRVQIGFYREFDITSFFEQVKLTTFERVGEMFRYTIGNFDSEREAETFKLAIRRMGIKDAFVSLYSDGERIAK